MKIIVGSNNPAKLNAVKEVFQEAHVTGAKVASNVSEQPFSDLETLEGAENRALACSKLQKDVIGIGLEGGVMEINGKMFVCNWGALVDENGNIYKAGGARIPLPDEVTEELRKGIELGDIMDAFTKKKGIRKKEGAIGVFTNQHINRMMMFTHVVKMLKGQYELAQIQKADE